MKITTEPITLHTGLTILPYSETTRQQNGLVAIAGFGDEYHTQPSDTVGSVMLKCCTDPPPSDHCDHCGAPGDRVQPLGEISSQMEHSPKGRLDVDIEFRETMK